MRTLPAAVRLLAALHGVCSGKSSPRQAAAAFSEALKHVTQVWVKLRIVRGGTGVRGVAALQLPSQEHVMQVWRGMAYMEEWCDILLEYRRGAAPTGVFLYQKE